MHSKKDLLNQEHAKLIIAISIIFYKIQQLSIDNVSKTPTDQIDGRVNKTNEEMRKKFEWPDLKNHIPKDGIKQNKTEI